MTGLALTYGATLLPGVGWSGDTAKFQYLGAVLGTGHAPGHPLYVMVNYLFSHVPFGSLALRANLLSAACAISAMLVLYTLLRELGHRPMIALTTSAACALTPTIWTNAVVAEVYTLVLLLILATLLPLARWVRTHQRRYLFTALAIYALSLGAHTMVVLLAPAILYVIWRTDRWLLVEPRFIAMALAFAALGMSQYGYLAWRTSDPLTPYIETQVSDWQSLWRTLSGGPFAGRMFAFGWRELLAVRLPEAGGFIKRDLGWLVLPLAVGAFRLRRSPLAQAVALTMLVFVIFALNYRVFDVHDFYQPAYVLGMIFVAEGLAVLVDWLGNRVPLVRFRGGVVALTLGVPLALFAVNLDVADRSDDTKMARQAEAVLAAVPDRSVLITQDYALATPLWYYAIGEGDTDRRDIFAEHYRFSNGARQVANYVHGAPLRLRYQRTTLPPGHGVYVMDARLARRLSEYGLTLQALSLPLAGERAPLVIHRVLAPDEPAR